LEFFENNFTAKFGQLILRKIIKIVATRCYILTLKCTTFNPAWGAHSNPPDPLTGFEVVLLLREGAYLTGA